jgi:tetrahydromethanopterin S-methyltransferase subunit C
MIKYQEISCSGCLKRNESQQGTLSLLRICTQMLWFVSKYVTASPIYFISIESMYFYLSDE